jgi:hypothetical protein
MGGEKAAADTGYQPVSLKSRENENLKILDVG